MPDAVGPREAEARALRIVANPGPVAFVNPVTLYRANELDPVSERRIGPILVAYGWLWDTYSFHGKLDGTFWRRFV
jgi:hypothetical protein